jgi:hypothetical protein
MVCPTLLMLLQLEEVLAACAVNLTGTPDDTVPGRVGE